MSNLRAVLESAGTSLDNVVKCNIFLTSMSDFNAVTEVYTTFFSAPMPVSFTALSRCIIHMLANGVDRRVRAFV
jgi:enamine deaminase RidA (YjgF/YER057c/UK114 family)